MMDGLPRHTKTNLPLRLPCPEGLKFLRRNGKTIGTNHKIFIILQILCLAVGALYTVSIPGKGFRLAVNQEHTRYSAGVVWLELAGAEMIKWP
jgi:hypothetical protein